MFSLQQDKLAARLIHSLIARLTTITVFKNAYACDFYTLLRFHCRSR